MDLVDFLNKPFDDLQRVSKSFSAFTKRTVEYRDREAALTTRTHARAAVVHYTNVHSIPRKDVVLSASFSHQCQKSIEEYHRIRQDIWSNNGASTLFALNVMQSPGGDATILVECEDSLHRIIVVCHRAHHRTAIQHGQKMDTDTALRVLDAWIPPLLKPDEYSGYETAMRRLNFQDTGVPVFYLCATSLHPIAKTTDAPPITKCTRSDPGLRVSADGNAMQLGDSRAELPSLSVVRGRLCFTKASGEKKFLEPHPASSLALEHGSLVFYGKDGAVTIPLPDINVDGDAIVVRRASGETDRILVNAKKPSAMVGARQSGKKGSGGLVPAPKSPNHVLFGDAMWGKLLFLNISTNVSRCPGIFVFTRKEACGLQLARRRSISEFV